MQSTANKAQLTQGMYVTHVCTSVQVGSVREKVPEGMNTNIQIIHTTLKCYETFMQISARQVAQINTSSAHMEEK